MNISLILVLLLFITYKSYSQQQYVVSTLAGSSIAGSNDGIGNDASFNKPTGVAVDANGNVYVADLGNHLIRKISASGLVTTLAGSGIGAGTDFGSFSDGPSKTASFCQPSSVAVDDSGNVYVADQFNHRIRKITVDGGVSTLAGTGNYRYNGEGTYATFDLPYGVAVSKSGNVYVADYFNNRIRKITVNGELTNLSGNGNFEYNGNGTYEFFELICGTSLDDLGNAYVKDHFDCWIRYITPSGFVTTIAGSGDTTYSDGNGSDASFHYPSGVAVDAFGNVYVADENNHRIRKISTNGVVTTLAGSGNNDNIDGIGTSASFSYPSGLAVDILGNVYVADTYNHLIRKITPSGIVTTIAGSGIGTFANGYGTKASFDFPTGVAVDNSGNLYVVDTDNHRIRKLSPIPIIYDSQFFRKEYSLDHNPAKSNLMIGLDQATQIQVINSLGQILITQKVNEGISTISTTSIESGIYRMLAEGYKPKTIIISK